MEEALKARSLELLQSRHLMTVATVRQDGYPQATLLNYIADDFTPYFAADASSQKVAIASRTEDSSGLARRSNVVPCMRRDEIR